MSDAEDIGRKREAAAALVGKLVVFAHRPPSVLPARVLSADDDGMVQLEGWSGSFAPHLFIEYP